ncbi:MAG: hypothetical protein ACPHUF_16150 [Gammaproteobacteria bacterium]
MPSWIAAWIGLFALGMLIAVMLDAENRRKNLPLAAAMAVIVGVVAYILVAR